MAIDSELLKSEREQLKATLREVEAEQRKLEQQVKQLRQREIRAKRELEALTTLIDINTPDESPDASDAPAQARA